MQGAFCFGGSTAGARCQTARACESTRSIAICRRIGPRSTIQRATGNLTAQAPANSVYIESAILTFARSRQPPLQYVCSGELYSGRPGSHRKLPAGFGDWGLPPLARNQHRTHSKNLSQYHQCLLEPFCTPSLLCARSSLRQSHRGEARADAVRFCAFSCFRVSCLSTEPAVRQVWDAAPRRRSEVVVYVGGLHFICGCSFAGADAQLAGQPLLRRSHLVVPEQPIAPLVGFTTISKAHNLCDPRELGERHPPTQGKADKNRPTRDRDRRERGSRLAGTPAHKCLCRSIYPWREGCRTGLFGDLQWRKPDLVSSIRPRQTRHRHCEQSRSISKYELCRGCRRRNNAACGYGDSERHIRFGKFDIRAAAVCKAGSTAHASDISISFEKNVHRHH